MENRRERVIATYPTNTEKVIEVSVRYEIGGISYLTGQQTARGYYLGATPIERSDGIVSFTLFSGLKRLLTPAARFSEKGLVLAVAAASEAVVIPLVQAVLTKNNLTLAIAPAPAAV